jgi:hypothetical protein
VGKMSRKRKAVKKEISRQESLSKSLRFKVERFKRAMQGDVDAIVECSYAFGMCSKESLNDYYKSKERHGDQDDE